MKKSISQSYSSCFRDKRMDTSEITELKEAWFNNGWDLFIKGRIGLKNYTKVFAELLGEIILESRLIVFTGGFTLFGLNSRYSVLLGLTDNLSLTQDSIVERANELSLGENDK